MVTPHNQCRPIPRRRQRYKRKPTRKRPDSRPPRWTTRKMQRTTTRKVARLRRRARRQLLLRVNRRLAQVQPLAAPLPPLPPVVRARRVQALQPRWRQRYKRKPTRKRPDSRPPRWTTRKMQRTTTRKVARLRRRARRQRNHQLPRHRRRQLLLRVNRRLAQVQPLAAPLPLVVRARRVQALQPRRHLPLPPPRRLQPTQPPIPVPQTRIR